MTVQTDALQLLLSLAASEGGSPQGRLPHLHPGLIRQTVRLARANGLFFLAVNQLKICGEDISPFREALLREERKRQAYLETIRLLNTIEANLGLRFIIIKACTSVSHVPRDIDIFVSPTDKAEFSQALKDSGMKCVYNSPAESSYAGPGYTELDIYTSIIYANKTFFDEDFLWQARSTEEKNGLSYPALQAYANYPLILVHSLFGHRVMSLLDFLHLRNLRLRADLNASRDYACKMGWGEVLDIATAKLEYIERDLGSQLPTVSFPLLFDHSFVLDCFSKLQSNRQGKFRPSAALQLSLLIDRLVHELRKSPFYEPLERLKFPGKVATNLGLVVRRLRGDRKA